MPVRMTQLGGFGFSAAAAVDPLGDWLNWDGTLDASALDLGSNFAGTMKSSISWFNKSTNTFILVQRNGNTNILLQRYTLDGSDVPATVGSALDFDFVTNEENINNAAGCLTVAYVFDDYVVVGYDGAAVSVNLQANLLPVTLSGGNLSAGTVVVPSGSLITNNRSTNTSGCNHKLIKVADDKLIFCYIATSTLEVAFVDVTTTTPVVGNTLTVPNGDQVTTAYSLGYDVFNATLAVGLNRGSPSAHTMRLQTVALNVGAGTFGTFGTRSISGTSATTDWRWISIAAANDESTDWVMVWGREGNTDDQGYALFRANVDPSIAAAVIDEFNFAQNTEAYADIKLVQDRVFMVTYNERSGASLKFAEIIDVATDPDVIAIAQTITNVDVSGADHNAVDTFIFSGTKIVWYKKLASNNNGMRVRIADELEV